MTGRYSWYRCFQKKARWRKRSRVFSLKTGEQQQLTCCRVEDVVDTNLEWNNLTLTLYLGFLCNQKKIFLALRKFVLRRITGIEIYDLHIKKSRPATMRRNVCNLSKRTANPSVAFSALDAKVGIPAGEDLPVKQTTVPCFWSTLVVIISCLIGWNCAWKGLPKNIGVVLKFFFTTLIV